MMNKKNIVYRILIGFGAIFCSTGLLFAYINVHTETSLNILPPPYQIIFSPPYITGTSTSGPVYVNIVGDGIKPITSTGIFHNGTYIFGFYRGTGPFVTGAAYSSGNMWTFMQTSGIVHRINDIAPTFGGVVDGVTYTTPVTIVFSDDSPGVTATLNGLPFAYGSSISTNGTYQLIVTDAAGHTTGATFIIYLTTTPPGGGGGGGLPAIGVGELIDSQCETRSCYSYYYDDICGSCTPPEIPPLPSDWPPYHYITPSNPNIDNSPYPQERNDAYLRAYHLGITTMNSIEEADMDAPLLRKFAAKMASEFAIKVIGLHPDETRLCEFNDIDKEIPELQYYMRLSCKLGIMGLDYYGEPDILFNPNYPVTRDQFVTILSRILFRNEFNIKQGELTIYEKAKNFVSHSLSNVSKALGINLNITTPLEWYTKHLEAIKRLGIITNYTLSIKEFRGYVMIIMYRIDKIGLNQVQNIINTPVDPLQ